MALRRRAKGAEQSEAEALLGEFSALLRRLGSPPDSGQESFYQPVAGAFLASYQQNILIPIELPAIARAYQNAASGQWRELLALDAALGRDPLLQPFADGSRQIARAQLEELRPLRDERMARRYLAAVEGGQAVGWHTIVYGIILAVYSWPLRQGLIHYGNETMAGLAAASRSAPRAVDGEAVRAAVEQLLADSCQLA